MCLKWGWDPFTTQKTFEQWIYLYLGTIASKVEEVQLYDKPLAELTAELAAGFFNPEGLKKYLELKHHAKDIDSGKSSLNYGSSGGSAVANTRVSGDEVLDADGNKIMSVDDLNEILSSLG